MGIITRMRKQTAVYWPLASVDSGGVAADDYGVPEVTNPFEISVRWEDRNEEFLDATQTRQLSNAIVFVDRDVDVGGILMLGVLTDVVAGADVKDKNRTAFEIKRYDKLPNLRATEFLRTAFL